MAVSSFYGHLNASTSCNLVVCSASCGNTPCLRLGTVVATGPRGEGLGAFKLRSSLLDVGGK